jgi:undecaprenyl-diphosphatase
VHYPTDILGGAVLGAGITYFLTDATMRRRISAWPLAQMKKYPGTAYALLFLISYLIATLFGELRRGGLDIYHYLST